MGLVAQPREREREQERAGNREREREPGRKHKMREFILGSPRSPRTLHLWTGSYRRVSERELMQGFLVVVFSHLWPPLHNSWRWPTLSSCLHLGAEKRPSVGVGSRFGVFACACLRVCECVLGSEKRLGFERGWSWDTPLLSIFFMKVHFHHIPTLSEVNMGQQVA